MNIEEMKRRIRAATPEMSAIMGYGQPSRNGLRENNNVETSTSTTPYGENHDDDRPVDGRGDQGAKALGLSGNDTRRKRSLADGSAYTPTGETSGTVFEADTMP